MGSRGLVLAMTMTACSEEALPSRFTPVDAPAHLAWPSEEEFQGNAQAWVARPIELIRGRTRITGSSYEETGEAMWSVSVDERVADVELIGAAGELYFYGRRCPIVSRGEVWIFDCESERVEVEVPGWSQSTAAISDAYWRDWVYAATLLERTGDLYDPPSASDRVLAPRSKAPQWAQVIEALEQHAPDAIERLWAMVDLAETSQSSEYWGLALEALGDRDAALTLAIHRRYRPFGGCSMDRRPQAVAEAYAERCFDAGDLECFVRLEADVIGNRFHRVAYSSYGEAARATGVDSLARAGIDVRRFLVGALLRFDAKGPDAQPVERDELSLYSVVKAMHEWDGRELEQELTTLAEDPSLDENNRVRAARALSYLLRSRLGGEVSAARLAVMKLSAASHAMLAWDR